MTDNIKSLEPVAWECSSPEGEKPALAFLTSKKPTVEHYENQGWRVLPLYAAPVDDKFMNVELSTETVDKPVHKLPEDRVSRVAIVVKDVVETLMLWNGQACAGLDVNGLADLRRRTRIYRSQRQR